MKAIALFLLIVTAAHAVDDARFLAAIATWEGGSRRGPAGETGPYQMMPATRHDAGGDDEAAALRHLRRIEREFKDARIDANAYNLALAWNAGVERVRSSRCEVRHYRYATEVTRIYLDATRARNSTTVPR